MASDIFPDISDVDVDSFPLDSPGDDFLEEEQDGEDEAIPYGISWKFDFSIGDLYTDNSGQFVETKDLDTLHEWVGHTLNTWRWETPIFSGDIGTEVHHLIGARTTVDGGVLVRLEEEIITAINIHDRVEFVEVVVLIPVDYDIFAVFRYTTDDGQTNTEVVAV